MTLARRDARSATVCARRRGYEHVTRSGGEGPQSRSGGDRPSRVLAVLLIAVALVGLVVCLTTDVLV